MNALHLSRIKAYDPDAHATLNTSGEIFVTVSGMGRWDRMEHILCCVNSLLPARLSLRWQDSRNGDECAIFVDACDENEDAPPGPNRRAPDECAHYRCEG